MGHAATNINLKVMSLYKNHFYHQHIKNYTVVMGSLLNGIDVVRYKQDGTEDSRETVPVTYANKEKFVQRLLSDPNLDRQVAIKLPRISFELVSMQYDPSRKLSGKLQFAYQNGANKTFSVYTPVAYDFTYTVSIIAKTQTDALQIVEQIVPFFTPDYTVHMKAIDSPNITYDVPVSLLSVSNSDSYDGEFDNRRMLVWSMVFLIKGFLFSPVRESGKIKEIDLTFYDKDELVKAPQLQQYLLNTTLTPFINGVPVNSIQEEDDWVVNRVDNDPFGMNGGLSFVGGNWVANPQV